MSKFSFCVRSFFSCAIGRLQKSPCFLVSARSVPKSLRISESSASRTTQCDSRVETTPVRSISAYSPVARFVLSISPLRGWPRCAPRSALRLHNQIVHLPYQAAEHGRNQNVTKTPRGSRGVQHTVLSCSNTSTCDITFIVIAISSESSRTHTQSIIRVPPLDQDQKQAESSIRSCSRPRVSRPDPLRFRQRCTRCRFPPLFPICASKDASRVSPLFMTPAVPRACQCQAA